MELFIYPCSADSHRRQAGVNISTTVDSVNGTPAGGLSDADATAGCYLNSSIKSLCLEFINAYKDVFKDKKEKFLEFLEVMLDIKKQRIGLTEVIRRLEKLIQGHDNLIICFNSFMPKKYEIRLPRDQRPLDIQEAIRLADKVKDHFQSEEHVYNSLFNILNPRMRMNKSAAEVLREVGALCGDLDLVEQFVHFLSLDAATSRIPESTSHEGRRSSVLPTERKPLIKKLKVKGCDSDAKFSLGIDPDGHEHVKMSGDKEKETEGADGSHQILETPSKNGTRADHMKRKRADRKCEDEIEMERLHRHCPYASGDSAIENTCTPSYYLRPSQDMRSDATQRTELDASVLNDVWVSMASIAMSKEEVKIKSMERHRKRHKSVERQNEREDDMYELDILLEFVRKTIKQVEECFEKVSKKIINTSNAFNMESHFTAVSRRCIEKVYGDYGLDVINLLQENFEGALPIILARLHQKEMEWKRYRTNI